MLRTSTERVIRSVVSVLLVGGFAAAFLWDGYSGYARKNRAELVRTLGWTGPTPRIITELTDGDSWASRIQSERWGTASLKQKLGEPSLVIQGDWYFVGPAGWLKVQTAGERIVGAVWQEGPKTATDQMLQRLIGWVLAAFTVLLLIQLARVFATRMELGDEVLSVRGLGKIPLEAVTDVRPHPSGAKGAFELEYLHEGRLRRVPLSSYQYKGLPRIVAAIQQRMAARQGEAAGPIWKAGG